NLHAAQVHGANAATDFLIVKDRAQKFPVLIFRDAPFGLVAANLLIERIQKLLTGSCARERGAMVKRAAEPAKIEQAFRRSVEGDAHPVEQINDSRSGIAHGLHWRLVGKKVSAVHRVIKMLPGGVTFAF